MLQIGPYVYWWTLTKSLSQTHYLPLPKNVYLFFSLVVLYFVMHIIYLASELIPKTIFVEADIFDNVVKPSKT